MNNFYALEFSRKKRNKTNQPNKQNVQHKEKREKKGEEKRREKEIKLFALVCCDLRSSSLLID